MERIGVIDIDNMNYIFNENSLIFLTSIDNAFKIMEIVNNKKIKKRWFKQKG